MAAERPNVFSIPAGAPFLPTLADALLDQRLGRFDRADPLALADVTVLLPTRRAVRAFREVLVARLGGDAAILPKIRPLGDIDEEDQLLAPDAEASADRLLLPLSISRLERRLELTRLILAWGRAIRRELLAFGPDEPLLIPTSAADASRLAADLARLIDDMETAGVPWDRLRELVPENQARYFEITLDFLKIAAEFWPQRLVELDRVDPAERRDRLLRAEAERLTQNPPRAPIVAAGSTGSIRATAALLLAIARLPNGAVVLPGLDQSLDEAAWTAIGEPGLTPASASGHPQFGLKQLIKALEIARDEVLPLGSVSAPIAARTKLASEALRPAETTESWGAFRESVSEFDAALSGVGLVIAHNEHEEAVAIALAIREALENAARTIALVTPDRTLARRVAAELGRYGLGVDDSAGARLDLLPVGIFARLLAAAATADGDPATLLALLKHPLAAFGMDRFDTRRAARIIEVAIFRGHRVVGGIAALPGVLAVRRAESESNEQRRHVPRARRRLRSDEWSLAARLVERLGTVLGPVEAAFRERREIAVGEATALLLEALDGATRDEKGSDDHLKDAPGADALLALLASLAEWGDGITTAPSEYPAFVGSLLGEVAVTRPPGADPRIHIWGTLEARLQSADFLILGGLDEGIWPSATRTDPWLSRTMRAEIGLPPPERRIGLSAHDFALGFAAEKVLVTRAEKRGGTPTVASRWLQRLEALLGEDRWRELRARGQTYVELARHIDRGSVVARPVKQPKPRPPLDARPRRLSVTEIETLIRDPYEIYAKHVLRLEALDPLGRAPDYAMKGNIIHDALGEFGQTWTGPFDAAAEARLLEIGRASLAEIADFPDVHALWSVRFRAMARWLIRWEAERESEVARRNAEIPGALPIEAPGGEFILRGRADRIDLRRDGAVDILDFKTGSPRTAKQVLVGLAPQLALEAAMARSGGFGDDFRGRSVALLAWIGLNRVERGRPVLSAVERGLTADEVAARALALLTELVGAFDDPETAYVSRARPMFELRYESPYDHLARVREWALVESEEDLLWAGVPPTR